MNYGNIKECDIADGPGVRVSLFVSGCRHHCKGCFNEETWNFNYGQPYTEETEAEILNSLDSNFIQGFTLLGGEPFEPENQRALVPFLKRVRTECPNKDVWCFSGYTLDGELMKASRARCECTDEMLSLIDVLVDGRYVEALRNLALTFRGSENQRIIDLNQTRKQGRIVLWEEE